MEYDPSKDYTWVKGKCGKLQGQSMYVPELRVHLFVLKTEKGWCGVAKFLYQEDNKTFNTKPLKLMKDAKSCLVNNLVTGLCKCQFKIMATIAE